MSLLPGKTFKNWQKPAPRASSAAKQAQKIEKKHREGTESAQRQFPSPLFCKKWDPEAPQMDSKIMQKSIKKQFRCLFFPYRVLLLVFYQFPIEFYAKNRWKLGRTCHGNCMLEHARLKVRMSILYCKNQYKTHFFQNRKSYKMNEILRKIGKIDERNKGPKKSSLGMPFWSIFELFSVHFGIQMPPEPVPKRDRFFGQKKGGKKTP